MISFIIPAYNEEKYIEKTISAIQLAAKLVGEPFEVIVSNDASTDQTPVIASKMGAIVVNGSNRQIAATRNSGAKIAKGDIFIFVDADTIINEKAVRAVIKAIQNGLIGGGASFQFDEAPLYGRLLNSMCILLFRMSRLAAGCFIFCTRQGFEKTGGFDETYFGAEEIIFSNALKKHGKFRLLPEKVTTSGRKLKSYSGWQVFKMMGSLFIRGPNSVRQRKGMEFWYDGKKNRL
jgi:glycosyltransferase involved in cell wall biosynthesis